MSRSPSNFWRSNRHTNPTQPSLHRRGNSHGDALAVTSQPSRAHANMPQRSQSTERSGSVASHTSTMRGMERLEQRRIVEERNFLQSKRRSQNWNPPLDLRLLEYITAYDDNLMCPICRCPFVDPVILSECDHCFCRDCIRQTWTHSSSYSPLGPRGDCPTCRTPAKLGPRSSTSKILVNILDDLLVKCPKTDEGCSANIKRGEVQDHMTIYCGFVLIECLASGCALPVRRNEAARGCLHFSVSCLACREEMQQCNLETHWQSKCPDRMVTCEACKNAVYYRQLSEHSQKLCPSISTPCPGESLGCTTRSKRGQAEIHTNSCTLAKLAPFMTAQSQRLDEQEAAQKAMSRKLEVLQDGFANMHRIMYPNADDPDQISADPSSIPLLHGHGSEDSDASSATGSLPIGLATMDSPFHEFDASPNRSRRSRRVTLEGESSDRTVPEAPGPRPRDLPEPYRLDFDLMSPFPPPAANGPYASPLHHLLSMHESLRDEMSRVNNAIQELDGRHSMQILNENLRTREEITYIGAQVAGLSRQVHWLTSAQLQGRSATPGAAASAGEMGAAGPSVESAISSAVRGAARIVNAGREGMAMRRGPSEEGRTKL